MQALLETADGFIQVTIPDGETFVQYCANRVAYGHWLDDQRTKFIPPGAIHKITLLTNV